MASAENAKPLTINGTGRLVSNVGNHTGDERNFVAFRDLITDAKGIIRKRPGIGPAKGAAAGAALPAMHEYVYTNPTTGAETRWLLRATATQISYYDRGANAWVAMAFPTGFAVSPGGLWVFENVPIGLTSYCLACNGKDALIVFDGTAWTIAGVDGPVSPMGYTLGGVYGFGGAFGAVTTVNVTKGSKTIAGIGGTQWLTFAEGPITAGMQIEINGNVYEVGSVAADNSLDLTEQFKEDTAPGLPYRIFYGFAAWNKAPRYGYAYEHPTTGHSSNIRAAALATRNILELAEQDQKGRKITLTNIVYSPAAHAQGYTKIRIYRSAKDANILQALDTTINNGAAPGSTTFSETASTFVDTFLTKFEAQDVKFGKPPSGFISVKYHQGRVFALTATRLYFSLHETEVIGQLGVAALAWPATQWISVNQPRGLVLVGAQGGDTSLVVQTGRGDFEVVGYDQRTAPIGLVKLPTRGGESFQYGAIGTEGLLLSFYRDRRLVDSNLTDYGDADIGDKMKAVNAALLSGARVHRFTAGDYDLILLSVPKTSGSATNDVTYVFDVDRRKWYEWTVGFTSFVTAVNPTTGETELWASRSDGNSFLLLQPAVWQDAGVNFTPLLKTSVLWPSGEFADTDFVQIQAFTSDSTQTWAGELLIEGQADGGGFSFAMKAARHQHRSMPGKVDWTPTSSTRTKAQPFQISVTFPTINADAYIEQIAVLFDLATAGAQG
jgi:hypothetical protein